MADAMKLLPRWESGCSAFASCPRYTIDPMTRLIVTIDGPAGAGKSSVAREVAHRLGLEFLDTGAMYRGVAALAIEQGLDVKNAHEQVVELARSQPLRFDWRHDPPRLFAGEQDMTDRLRGPEVTDAVSEVAKIPHVREVLVDAQRRIGVEHPRLVTEGRDQGSVVFPDADVKFYLDASARVRAQRRVAQLHAMGQPADAPQILQGIIERDYKDSTRKDGPLICPDDARRIDTSEMTQAQVIDELVRRVELSQTQMK